MRREERSIEKRFGENFHIALADFNFDWTCEDKEDFEQMYWRGYSLEEMMERFNRPREEIIVMGMDCKRRGRTFKL
ncbi:hypothetical protein FZC79_10340 [Rossellomorea vietnamensis]|uniref:Uncharacterized protein n=1 Tax=Rossellomorea vietnamensis TaxID=218284 RepID=A0A5D4KFH5_9BACI|nr:hypothetical protein [Rossellomorea vietnamensis]TYR75560.1 hypothetical protein FZC79_10340 [Rossellomorea vietnamensis]